MKTALSIAGSDSSAGAGIQADIKAMTMNGVYATTAITALTAQNTTGVRAIMEVTPQFLAQQIDAVFEDIRPDAVKIGMVSSPELVNTIAERLHFYHAQNIVVDPVVVATSGSVLARSEAVSLLKSVLLEINPPTSFCPYIYNGCAVLCKGGHSVSDANDLLYADGEATWFYGKRIQNPNTHGTGCTLSSAIAAHLALGEDLKTAIQKSKEYISQALAAMLDLGHGSGPLDHAFILRKDLLQ